MGANAVGVLLDRLSEFEWTIELTMIKEDKTPFVRKRPDEGGFFFWRIKQIPAE